MSVSPAKTIQAQLLAWTDIASTAGTVNVGAAFDVSTKFAIGLGIRLGRESGSAFTAGWPNVRVEYSTKASGSNSWIPVPYGYQMNVGVATIGNSTVNGAITGGSGNTFTITSATNFAIGNIIFIKDTSSSNYEICRITAISGTTITVEETIVNNHANGTQVTNQAEITSMSLDVTTFTRIRVVVDNAGGGQAFACEISLITLDSVG